MSPTSRTLKMMVAMRGTGTVHHCKYNLCWCSLLNQLMQGQASLQMGQPVVIHMPKFSYRCDNIMISRLVEIWNGRVCTFILLGAHQNAKTSLQHSVCIYAKILHPLDRSLLNTTHMYAIIYPGGRNFYCRLFECIYV